MLYIVFLSFELTTRIDRFKRTFPEIFLRLGDACNNSQRGLEISSNHLDSYASNHLNSLFSEVLYRHCMRKLNFEAATLIFQLDGSLSMINISNSFRTILFCQI